MTFFAFELERALDGDILKKIAGAYLCSFAIDLFWIIFFCGVRFLFAYE
jgi:hypothetical protein